MSDANGHDFNEEENAPEHSSPLEFPCDFMIKAMGKADAAFEDTVLSIIQTEFSNIQKDDLKKRPSKDNNYIALTVTVHAESKDQLDRIYKALSDAPEVLMAL